MFTDVTDRKHAEDAVRRTSEERERTLVELQTKTEELRATTQQLWQAARLAGVGELAASIAHELNNPLGTVSLRIENLLAKTPLDDPRRKLMEVIDGEIERMAGLVANLLQFSRAGRDQVSTVDVREEINRTLELVSHHLRKRRVKVSTEFADKLPTIHADRQQLRQVLLNLFTNAADAMPEGGQLAPRARPAELPGGVAAVEIEVADTGTGIATELLPRVFDPFFTTKEEGKGTGLGLAICKRIVAQHHGTLGIESEVGQGTTVRVKLPVHPDINVTSLQAR
jgi:signal transduction histidine kinase